MIPNGVDVRSFSAGDAAARLPAGGRHGRLPRPDRRAAQGPDVLLAALPAHRRGRPDVRLLVAGRGDIDDVTRSCPPALAGRVTFLGLVSDEDKARMLRTVDVYVAPNTGGESFGIVLLEAMAAGAPVLASDLDAFPQVLDDGQAGALFANGDAGLAWPPRWPRCWTTRTAGPGWPPPAARSSPVRLGRRRPARPGRLRDGDRGEARVR